MTELPLPIVGLLLLMMMMIVIAIPPHIFHIIISLSSFWQTNNSRNEQWWWKWIQNYTDKIRRCRFDNSISSPRDCHKSHPLRFLWTLVSHRFSFACMRVSEWERQNEKLDKMCKCTLQRTYEANWNDTISSKILLCFLTTQI